MVPIHPRRRNVTTSMVRLKNSHIGKNLTQHGKPQRYSWGMQKENGAHRHGRYDRIWLKSLHVVANVKICAT